MPHRLYHRCVTFLGVLAVLAALCAASLTTPHALAMHVASSASQVADGHAMPCHKAAKPAKPCPMCPADANGCLASCAAHCAAMPALPFVDLPRAPIVAQQVLPALTSVTRGLLVPPLLRPPSA
jgi:hypothetical protein